MGGGGKFPKALPVMTGPPLPVVVVVVDTVLTGGRNVDDCDPSE